MQDMASGFNPFAPGFDFLKQLTDGKERLASSQFPQWTDWVAPTMNVQELDKRISELKTIQFWLEQNQRALAATIQALEVQKMTLATLQTMNVPMENLTASMVQGWRDLASAAEAPAPAPTPAPAAETTNPYSKAFTSAAATEAAAPAEPPAASSSAPDAAGASGVDAMQWWGALTQQFQQIASQALQDVAQRTMAQAAAANQAAAAASAEVMQKAEQVRAGMAKPARRAAAPSPRKAAPSPARSTPSAPKRSAAAASKAKAKSSPAKPRTR